MKKCYCTKSCTFIYAFFAELCSSRKKLRNRGLLSSLFCCFGGRGDPASAFVNASINSPDEAPNHNQNTIAKGYEPDIEEENSNEEQVCHCFKIYYLHSLLFCFLLWFHVCTSTGICETHAFFAADVRFHGNAYFVGKGSIHLCAESLLLLKLQDQGWNCESRKSFH